MKLERVALIVLTIDILVTAVFVGDAFDDLTVVVLFATVVTVVMVDFVAMVVVVAIVVGLMVMVVLAT